MSESRALGGTGLDADGPRIVRALGGQWHAGKGQCCCPAHKDARPSLLVTQRANGPVLLWCYAGCEGRAVIDALRGRGLWPDRDELGHKARPRPSLHSTTPEGPDEDEIARVREARAIWLASHPGPGTLVETYLRHRGVLGRIPPTLRFHPGLYNSETRRELPALVGAIQSGAGRITAVQRIWLRADGCGKALLETPKKTLGAMREGAIRLGRVGGMAGLAEGIETALSAAQTFSLPVWAALGASRMGNIAFPESVESVVIFADNGEPGLKAAIKASHAYSMQGMRVEICPPPDGAGDWNDYVKAIHGRGNG